LIPESDVAATNKTKRERAKAPVAGASWMALLAATTVGIGTIHRVRAAVSADPRQLADSQQGYRLIVQSYAPSSLSGGRMPGSRGRPLGSTQRAITPAELRKGVAVDVLGIGDGDESPVIVAWVESGRPDLDYDGLEARPPADAFYGVALAKGGADQLAATRVVLKRRAAG